MSNDKYKFNSWVAHHGYAQSSGDFVEISKHQVYRAIKDDPDFLKLKRFKIKVEQQTYPYLNNNYLYPIPRTFITGWHWCKNITEARKLGQVLEEVTTAVKKYPEAKKGSRKNATHPSKSNPKDKA